MTSSVVSPADLFAPADWLALLDVSLTAIHLVRPVYAPDGPDVVDFTLEYLNPAAQRTTGLPEQPGRSLRACFPDAAAAGVLAFYRRVFETGEAGRCDVHYRADGRDHYLHVAARRSGERLVVSLTDTSGPERGPVEAALRASQAREQQARAEAERQRGELQRVFAQAPAALAIFGGPRHLIEQVNDQHLALWGRTREQVLGRPLFEALPEAAGLGYEELLAGVLRTGQPYVAPESSARLLRYGHWEDVYFRFVYQPLREPDGHVSGVVVVANEITELVRARQQGQALHEALEARVQERTAQLQHSRDLLVQAEKVAGLGSWEYELASGQLRWSEGMYHLFGLPAGSPVSLDVYPRYALAADRAPARQLLADALGSPPPPPRALRVRIGRAVRTLAIRTVVLRDAAGAPRKVLGVDLDISEAQRQAQATLDLRLTQQQLLLLALLAAQEEERRRVAESLQNGVEQLLYATKLHLDRVPPLLPSPAGAELAALRQAQDLLAEAIRDTRHAAHELVPLLLQEFGVAAALRAFCARFVGRGLAFACYGLAELEGRLPEHLEIALYRIAQELVTNVVRHAQATRARLEVTQAGPALCLEVQDNGRGMAAAAAGPGFGLRTLENRVQLLNGTLQVDSAPGRGTLVTVVLPLPQVREKSGPQGLLKPPS